MKRISDVITCQIKGIWGQDPETQQPLTLVIKTNNMSYEGMINYEDISRRYIPIEKLPSFYLQTGDLLIEKSGGTKTHSVGYVNYFDGENNKYVCNNFILTLRPNPKLIQPKYLFYQLKYKYESGKFSDCYNKTTGIQNLQSKTYLSKKIKVPSLNDQIQCIEELDQIEQGFCLKQNQIKSLGSLAKSRFMEMFANVNKQKLSEMAEIIMGQSPDSKSYNELGNGLPFLQGKGDFGEKYTKVEHWTTLPTKTAKLNDVLMSVRAPVGPVNIASTDCCIGRGLCAIRAENGLTNSEFLYNALKVMEPEIALMGNGSTFKAINKKDVYSLLIPVASVQNQESFSKFASLVDKSRFVVHSRYFLWLNFTFESSTIAYSRVVSIFECPKRC